MLTPKRSYYGSNVSSQGSACDALTAWVEVRILNSSHNHRVVCYSWCRYSVSIVGVVDQYFPKLALLFLCSMPAYHINNNGLPDRVDQEHRHYWPIRSTTKVKSSTDVIQLILTLKMTSCRNVSHCQQLSPVQVDELWNYKRITKFSTFMTVLSESVLGFCSAWCSVIARVIMIFPNSPNF